MSGSLARAAPVRFLIAVAIAWTVGRGIALAGWQPDAGKAPRTHAPKPALAPRKPFVSVSAPPVAAPVAASSAPEAPPGVSPPPLLRPATLFRIDDQPGAIEHATRRPAPRNRMRPGAWPIARPLLELAAYEPGPIRGELRSGGIVESRAVIGPTQTGSRLSGSSWAFLRGGGRATALSSGGQIGGGQAGARILYAVDRPDRLAISARLSGTIGGIHQTEAALGIDWKPVTKIPVHLMLDRRVAIDKGGRNAWTLGAAGGAYDIRVAAHWRLDGYGEAGVVGAHRRDLYADGALRIARAIDLGSNRSLALGGGVWGAGQPGAARLDIGPSVVLRLPVAGHSVAAALDWRERVAGDAKPGSGVAFTLATDF